MKKSLLSSSIISPHFHVRDWDLQEIEYFVILEHVLLLKVLTAYKDVMGMKFLENSDE